MGLSPLRHVAQLHLCRHLWCLNVRQWLRPTALPLGTAATALVVVAAAALSRRLADCALPGERGVSHLWLRWYRPPAYSEADIQQLNCHGTVDVLPTSPGGGLLHTAVCDST